MEPCACQNLIDFSRFFEVRLDLFDGPIDLLLHLVKARELPIEKVSLAAVTEQYLRCIESIKGFDLEVAGEYLVIAATLLSIKSSVLLGEPVQLLPDEDGNMVDPHEQLLCRLREAAVYRESAGNLATRALLGLDVFAGPSALADLEDPEPVFRNHDPFLLGKAFKKLLEGLNDSPTLQIAVESVSIVQRMREVLDKLKSKGPLEFFRLVPDLCSRASIIATFVALLELCKRQIITVEQSAPEDVITVGLLVGVAADGVRLSSEFDADDSGAESAIANG